MGVIFKYIKKEDNSVIGYHLDTFCQCGPRDRAKVYGCETGEEIKSQMAIIDKNFSGMFKIKEGDDGLFAAGRLQIRNEQYAGLDREDIVIGWEDTEKEYNPNPVARLVIEDGLEKPVNKPLFEVLKDMILRRNAKKN